MSWHMQANGVQSGPMSEEELVTLARSGGLRPQDVVWCPGMPQWIEAWRAAPLVGVFPGIPSPYPRRMEDDPSMRALLPIGRSGWAIAAGYLGLLSPLLIPAPFAIGTGIVAITRIKKDTSLHGMGRAVFGIVMGIVCIIAGSVWLAGRYG